MRSQVLQNYVPVGAHVAPELEFTGERIVPGKTAEVLFHEHEERYIFAGQYVIGKDVLDVACGSGVGTSYLRRAGARSVTGLDIDSRSIAYARARYSDCQFMESDAMNLCLPDFSADVVVSFETLEHIKDPRRFLMECWRVLRPGGLLVCSTPNLEISRWSARNPYHLREMRPTEFEELVGSIFSSVQMYAQKERFLLSYAPRKTVRRTLGYLGLLENVESILGFGSKKESFPQEFARGVSAPDVSPYKKKILRCPTFLITVAAKSTS